jgi:hypothetical protein
MNIRRSPLPMFLMAVVCFVFAVILIRSMPSPVLPDGSVTIGTMEEYDRHRWKVPWIFILHFGTVVFLVLGFWRWFCRWKSKRDKKVAA